MQMKNMFLFLQIVNLSIKDKASKLFIAFNVFLPITPSSSTPTTLCANVTDVPVPAFTTNKTRS